MRYAFVVLVVLGAIFLNGPRCSGQEYDEFNIEFGMHEKTVAAKYGEPVLKKELKTGFLPIDRKKALYKMNDSDYMAILFFSGRIKKIDLLQDISFEEAKTFFERNN